MIDFIEIKLNLYEYKVGGDYVRKFQIGIKNKRTGRKKNSNYSAPQYTIIVNNLEKVATELLATICEFMPEYTKHNIDHSLNVLKIFEKILPDVDTLNITELVLLVYAAVYMI